MSAPTFAPGSSGTVPESESGQHAEESGWAHAWLKVFISGRVVRLSLRRRRICPDSQLSKHIDRERCKLRESCGQTRIWSLVKATREQNYESEAINLRGVFSRKRYNFNNFLFTLLNLPATLDEILTIWDNIYG
ncbi:uncharacterized protein RSE6_09162 [Rhynchosporium secalis]|uniref:Uncharacterized protein n=1 Tax=Rhynchosporium secalis TaxID=38038 RepID=A0A1E1MH99_RHYSE|nr:uncharacterized protein RSE6_09162 [Rhynchosporium secalis]